MISLNSVSKAHSIGSYHLGNTNAILDKSINRLSSGLRINSSVDAPGELGVASRLNSKVVYSSVLKRNLSNVSTFLEAQQAHLLQLAEIYRERMAIDIKKQSPLATADELRIYNSQDQMLYDRILQLKDAKFDGARLFSPDHNLVTNNLDTELINGSAEPIDKYPLEYRNERVKQMELIFVVDTTGSMGTTINNLRNNISNFISSQVAVKADTWKAKIVDFRDLTVGERIVDNPFVSTVGELQTQVNTLSPGGGGDLPESLIDGIARGFNSAGWSYDPEVVKGIVAFTDASTKLPVPASGTSSEIADRIKNAGVTTKIYGVTSDVNTVNFSNAAGASLSPFAESSNMSNALSGFLDSLIQVESGLVDYDTITRYIAENTTKQKTVSNLIDSSETFGANVKAALGQIQDLDVAKESIIKARYEILQNAGTAILAQANQSVNATLTLLT
jgi:flagellin-like hook-associated protein FlgL